MIEHIIEIDGLNQRILKHQSIIFEEEKRINLINQKIIDTKSRQEEIHQLIAGLHLKNLELEITNKEHQLAKVKEQSNLVRTEKELKSIENEILHLSKAVTQLEEDYFSKVDVSSKLEEEASDLRNFLVGIDETKTEIEAEVLSRIENEKKEIINYQKRIDSLLDELSPSYKKLYIETAKKFKNQSPCAFIHNKHCDRCRIAIDVVTIKACELKNTLEFCPNCGRILLSR